MKTIQLSPNEIQERTNLILKKNRIQRLKETRKTAALKSKQELIENSEISRKVWSDLLDELFRDWVKDQENQAEELLKLLDTIKTTEFGNSQKQAIMKESEKKSEIDNLLNSLINSQKTELKRSSKSSKLLLVEKINQLEPIWIKKALKESIKVQEQLRTKYLVEKQRAKLSELPTNIEIPSNPISKYKKEEFEETSFHRTFASVRCIAGYKIPISNPREEALKEIKRVQDFLQTKEIKKEEFEIIARSRYQNAINSVALDQRKEKLIKDLENINLEDKQRKQINSALHAKKFKFQPNALRDDLLSQNFVKKFNIEYSGPSIPQIERAREKVLNISKAFDEESSSSFEFISTGKVFSK